MAKRRPIQSKKNVSRRKRPKTKKPLISLINLIFPNKKGKKGGKDKRLITFFQWSSGILLLIFFLIWSGLQSLPTPIPSGDASPLIFGNQADDDLRKMYVEAIGEAKESIYLCMYSLSDSKVIRALKDKADEGVSVTVVHDPSTPQYGYQKLGEKIRNIERNGSGLMHQKILIVDKEKIWLGSANFTTQSLRMDGNLVVALGSSALAQTIIERNPIHPHEFSIGGQRVEFWSLPEDKVDGLERVISLIDTAEKTLRVAMFTWTHPDLTSAVIRAHKRNVSVEVVMDAGQAQGVCEKCFKELKKAGVLVKTNQDSNLLHYKFAYIDSKILINGSANWTKAAFSKNDDCFLVLHHLNEDQIKKMEQVWHAIRATSFHEKTGFVDDFQELKKAA